jgi:hypothetical protein
MQFAERHLQNQPGSENYRTTHKIFQSGIFPGHAHRASVSIVLAGKCSPSIEICLNAKKALKGTI